MPGTGIDPLSLAQSAIQLETGIVKTGIGLLNAGKTRAEAAALQRSRPFYNVNPNVQSETALAQSELSNGMSAGATKAYDQGIDSSLSASLDAILKGGGTANNVADVFDNSEQGRQRLAIMKDNLRLNQVNNLVSAYRNQTNESDKAFQFNQAAPYFDRVQANAEARKSANALAWSGVDSIGNAGQNLLSSAQSNNAFANYFGKSDYLPTHNQGLIRDNYLAPISSAYGLTNAAPQTIDMNLKPSITF